jgi:hypothetical protein
LAGAGRPSFRRFAALDVPSPAAVAAAATDAAAEIGFDQEVGADIAPFAAILGPFIVRTTLSPRTRLSDDTSAAPSAGVRDLTRA